MENEKNSAHALFEDVIRHTKNFIFKIEQEGHLEKNTQNDLSTYIFNCSLSLIMIYLSLKKLDKLNYLILEEYIKFLETTSADKDVALEELVSNGTWLSTIYPIDTVSYPVNRHILIEKICKGVSQLISTQKKGINLTEMMDGMEKYGTMSPHGSLVSDFINNIEISLKDHGIVLTEDDLPFK